MLVFVSDALSHGVDSNAAYGWAAGIVVGGKPNTLSKLGGSFSCVGAWGGGPTDQGGNFLSHCDVGVKFLQAGFDNAVRSNRVTDFGVTACDYSGALRTSGVHTNWTTDNQPWSCNRGY